MKDEFPEDTPNAEHRLHCLVGTKSVRNQDVDLTGDDMTFDEVGAGLTPANFLRTQRERYEEARLKALLGVAKPETRPKGLLKKVRRQRIRMKLENKARRQAQKQFVEEVRARKTEGFSVSQLLRSHIPEIGNEVKVSEAVVSKALKNAQAIVLF